MREEQADKANQSHGQHCCCIPFLIRPDRPANTICNLNKSRNRLHRLSYIIHTGAGSRARRKTWHRPPTKRTPTNKSKPTAPRAKIHPPAQRRKESRSARNGPRHRRLPERPRSRHRIAGPASVSSRVPSLPPTGVRHHRYEARVDRQFRNALPASTPPVGPISIDIETSNGLHRGNVFYLPGAERNNRTCLSVFESNPRSRTIHDHRLRDAAAGGIGYPCAAHRA